MGNKSASEHRFFSFRNPIIYGILGTISLFGIYVWLATSRSCQKGVCQSNYKHFLVSSPNEIGDTLAGIAGILAFLWIITTVFLQSKELKIARQEYEKMADAQTGQLELLKKQGEIFEVEQTEREMVRLASLTDELVKNLRWRIKTTPIQWISERDAYGNPGVLNLFPSVLSTKDEPNNDIFFNFVLNDLRDIVARLEESERNIPTSKSPKRFELRLLYSDTKVILAHIQKLSLTDTTRLNRLQLMDLKEAMDALLKNNDLWDQGQTP